MKRFLFHYLASHFLADRNSTTTNKEEKEQEIWRTQTNLWWFFLSFVVGLWLARKKKSQPKTTEGYDYYLSPSIFSSFVYINFSKDESENRRGNNLLYPSVSSHLCLGFGYIIKHSVQIPDDESRHHPTAISQRTSHKKIAFLFSGIAFGIGSLEAVGRFAKYYSDAHGR